MATSNGAVRVGELEPPAPSQVAKTVFPKQGFDPWFRHRSCMPQLRPSTVK